VETALVVECDELLQEEVHPVHHILPRDGVWALDARETRHVLILLVDTWERIIFLAAGAFNLKFSD
jgi:hypothetical protein